MIDSVTLRPAQIHDIPQLVELMNSQYDRKKDEKYYMWQYFGSFYSTVLMCAVSNDNIVGTFGLQRRGLSNGMTAGQATDLLVSPEWRGQGVFSRLGIEALSYFNDLDLLCVLPNIHGKNACERALGWKTLGKINSMVLKSNSPDVGAEELSITGKGCNKETVQFEYSSDLRKWRYDQHPDYNYAYVRLSSGEFSVVKIFTDPLTGNRYGDIVDFKCSLKRLDLIRELFVKSIEHLNKQGLKSVTSWAMPGTLLREVVESIGFVELSQERYFCVKVLKKEYEYLYDLSLWHLVQADSEIY